MGLYRVKLRLISDEIEINAGDEDIVLSQIHKKYGPGRVERITLVDPPDQPIESKPDSKLEVTKLSNFTLNNFVASTARPLPVIILADTSGSMGVDGKIEALNLSLNDMISRFAEEESGVAEIHVGIVTFGGSAMLHQDLMPAREVSRNPLVATGMTPMGAAFDIARELIEDKAKVPGRAYSPAIVLLSDGQPNDEWEAPLESLLNSPRAQKAQRFALGIGEDADAEVLRAFLNDPNAKVFGASDAHQIKSFFRWVTMSVSTRSRSVNPNSSVVDELPPSDLDELL